MKNRSIREIQQKPKASGPHRSRGAMECDDSGIAISRANPICPTSDSRTARATQTSPPFDRRGWRGGYRAKASPSPTVSVSGNATHFYDDFVTHRLLAGQESAGPKGGESYSEGRRRGGRVPTSGLAEGPRYPHEFSCARVAQTSPPPRRESLQHPQAHFRNKAYK